MVACLLGQDAAFGCFIMNAVRSWKQQEVAKVFTKSNYVLVDIPAGSAKLVLQTVSRQFCSTAILALVT